MDNNSEKKMTLAFLASFVLIIVAFFVLPKLKPQTTTTTTTGVVTYVTNDDGTVNVVAVEEEEEEVEVSTVTTVAVVEVKPFTYDQNAPVTNITLSYDDSVSLVVDSYGARITELDVDGEWNAFTNPVALTSASNQIPISDFYLGSLDELLDNTERPVYSIDSVDDREVKLVTVVDYNGTDIEVSRSFTLSSNYQILETTTLRNLSSSAVILDNDGTAFTIASMFSFTDKESMNPRNMIKYRYFDGDKLHDVLKVGFLKGITGNKPTEQLVLNPSWMTHEDNYFVGVIEPEETVFNGKYEITFEEKSYREVALGLVKEPMSLNAGETKSFNISYYIGPKKENVVRAVNDRYKKLFQFSPVFNWLMWPITKGIKGLMFLLGKIIPNWGLVIVLLALIIKLILSPLSIRSAISMRKTQMAQPRLKNLQEKYKDNPQVMQQKVMEFYRKEGINPLGGCWPMLLQIPVFFALFRVLSNSVELRGAAFLWIKDLTLPDTLFTLNFFPKTFNLLPLLMTGIQLVQMKLQQGKTKAVGMQQQSPLNTYMLPVMFLFLFWNMPAGLVLYWTIMNIYTIVEQQLIKFDKHIKLK